MAGVFTFGVAAIIAGGSSTFAEGLHKGEKPLKSFKNEQTGVVVEVFAANPEETEKVKKEQGWEDGEVETVKNPKAQEATEKSDLQEAVASAFNNGFNTIVENLGTITAKASTGWDLVGTEYWLMDGGYSKTHYDTIWNSTGGDYMFRMPAHNDSVLYSGTTPTMSVWLYEDDGSLGDDTVAGFTVKPSSYTLDYVARAIGGYVDGTNGYAEFYTTHNTNYNVSGGAISNVRYYD